MEIMGYTSRTRALEVSKLGVFSRCFKVGGHGTGKPIVLSFLVGLPESPHFERMRMRSIPSRLCVFLLLAAGCLFAQPWSTVLSPTRATNWAAGFTIPNYTVPCSTQPSLLA